MPSEKRARQRAARQLKKAAQARRVRRRKLLRNSAIVAAAAVVVIGAVLLTTGHGSPSSTTGSKGSTTTGATGTPASKGSTTTTSTTTTSTTLSSAQAAAAQKAANAVATAAGCPANPKTRVNTLTFSAPPALTIDTAKTYTATVKTTAGTFVITLDAKTAPNTVNSFVFLAQKGYFNCVIFHRVIPGFVDQTGDPTGTGSGGPGYKFANENVPKAYATGDVAMANAGPNTNGSQFFIVVPGGATQLDKDLANGGYSLFGTVTSGMSVVEKINSEGTASGTPAVIQRMLSVTIHES